jgi:hypothetical protein
VLAIIEKQGLQLPPLLDEIRRALPAYCRRQAKEIG